VIVEIQKGEKIMVDLIRDDWETGAPNPNWSSVHTNLTVQSNMVFSGNYAALMPQWGSVGLTNLSEPAIYSEAVFAVDEILTEPNKTIILHMSRPDAAVFAQLQIISGGRLQLYRTSPSVLSTFVDVDLQPGTWYRIGLLVDSTGYHIFLNDVEVATDAVEVAETIGRVYIGQYSAAAGDTANLYVDDVLIATTLPPILTVVIQGIVTDAETLLPIEGAAVFCNGYTVVTGADGIYQFADIPAHLYVLTVEAANYQSATVNIDATAGGTVQRDIALEPGITPPPPTSSTSMVVAFAVGAIALGIAVLG